MTNKLFIVASNTLGLQYCEKDAELMTSCFGKKYGYEILQPEIKKLIIETELDNLLDSCQKTDTVVLYFSGHSLVNRDKLYFLLADDTSKTSNKININNIIDEFEGCRATNKLVILDCCDAGTGLSSWSPKMSDRYFVLTASGFPEKAKEIDSIRASFLTYQLVQTLENSQANVISAENTIQLQTLYRALVTVTKEHNANSEIQIPIPNLVGNQKNDFALAKIEGFQRLPFDDEDLQEYLQFLIGRCATLDPRRVPRSSKTRNVVLPLEDIFISLKPGQNNPLEREAEQNLLDLEVEELMRTLGLDESADSFTDFRYQVLQREFFMLSEQWLNKTSHFKNIGEVLQKHRWLVLLGGPGSGKTTFAQWLTLQLAKAMLASMARFYVSSSKLRMSQKNIEIDLGPVRFPIFVRVADYAKARREETALTLRNFIGRHPILEQHSTVPTSKTIAICNHFIINGRALIILDGLDEIIDPVDRREIRDQIERFVIDSVEDPENRQAFAPWSTMSDKLDGNPSLPWWKSPQPSFPAVAGGNQVIITSRIAGYRASVLRGEFTHFVIEPLDDDSINTFCQKWCLSVERFLARQSDSPISDDEVEEHASREAKSLTEIIFQNKGVRKLASNPLLLTVLALLHRENSHLPAHRIRLYKQAVKALIDTRETNIDEAQAADFLGPFALWLHENQPTGLATEGELQERISEGLARWHGLDPKEPLPGKYKKEIESFIMQAREQSGLIVARGEGLYGFLHLSFQEYFVAIELTRNPFSVVENIRNYLHRPRWVEPLVLAIAYISDTQRGLLKSVLESILDTDADYEDILHRNLLFVANAIVDSVWIPPSILQRIVWEMLVILADKDGMGRFTLLREQIYGSLTEINRYDTHNTSGTVIHNALLSEPHLRRAAAEAILRVSWSSPQLLLGCYHAMAMESDLSTPSILVNAFNVLLKRIQQPNQYLPSHSLDSLVGLYGSDHDVKEAINRLSSSNGTVATFLSRWGRVIAPYVNPELINILKSFVRKNQRDEDIFLEQVETALIELANKYSGFVYDVSLMALDNLKGSDYVVNLLKQNIEANHKVQESTSMLVLRYDRVLDDPLFCTWLDKQDLNTKHLFLRLGAEVKHGWRLGNFAWQQLENSHLNEDTTSLKLLVHLPDIKLTASRLDALEKLIKFNGTKTGGIVEDLLEQAKLANESEETYSKLRYWLSSSDTTLSSCAALLLGQTIDYFDLEVYHKLTTALRSNNDRWRQWSVYVLSKPRRFFPKSIELIEESARLEWEEDHINNDGMASLTHSDFRRLILYDNFDCLQDWLKRYETTPIQKDKEILCKIISTVNFCTPELFEQLLDQVDLGDPKLVDECLVDSLVNIIEQNSDLIPLHVWSLPNKSLQKAIGSLSLIIQNRTDDLTMQKYVASGIGMISRFSQVAGEEFSRLLEFDETNIKLATIHGLGVLATYLKGNSNFRESIAKTLVELIESNDNLLRTQALASLTKSLVVSQLEPGKVCDTLLNHCVDEDEFLTSMFLAGESDDIWDDITCDCGREFHSKLVEIFLLLAVRPPLLSLEKIARHVIAVSNLPTNKWAQKRFPLAVLAACAKQLPASLNKLSCIKSLQERLLVTAIDTSSYNVRRFSLEILGQFRWVSSEVVDVLVSGCRDLGIVQKSSLVAIASMRRLDTSALPKLKDLLYSSSTATVYTAAKVMKEIGLSQQAVRDLALRDSIIEGIADAVRRSVFPRYVTIEGKKVGLLVDRLFSILFELTSDEPLESDQEQEILESQLAFSGLERSPIQSLQNLQQIREQAVQMQQSLSTEAFEIKTDKYKIVMSGSQEIVVLEIEGNGDVQAKQLLNEVIKLSRNVAAKMLQENLNLPVGNLDSLRDKAKEMQTKLAEVRIPVDESGYRIVITGDQRFEEVVISGIQDDELIHLLNEAVKRSQTMAAGKLQELVSSNSVANEPLESDQEQEILESQLAFSGPERSPVQSLQNLQQLREQAVQMQQSLSTEAFEIKTDKYKIVMSGSQEIVVLEIEGNGDVQAKQLLNEVIKLSRNVAAKMLQENLNLPVGNLDSLRDKAKEMQTKLAEVRIPVDESGYRIVITGDQRFEEVVISGIQDDELIHLLNEAVKRSQTMAAGKLQGILSTLPTVIN